MSKEKDVNTDKFIWKKDDIKIIKKGTKK